jgi:hypothetical protein
MYAKWEMWHADVGRSKIRVLQEKLNALLDFLRTSTRKHHLFEDAYMSRIWRRYHMELSVSFPPRTSRCSVIDPLSLQVTPCTHH